MPAEYLMIQMNCGRQRMIISAIALIALLLPASGDAALLDKQELLDRQSFWDNRDWDWYKENIPFFECPDAEINTTYYYRWELVTKHLTYGSPNSGYSFTEFIDRPFWSGAYGSISCPAGHQLYEIRWLRDARFARDYSRYWFRTPGAEPRRYGCWLSDAVWAVQMVHPDDAFVKDLLPDLHKNFQGWEKRQFVPEIGLFWQNGHDDGMEYNITSRQTEDIVRGANGYRPSFNSYMYADALAISHIAALAGDGPAARSYADRAASIKEKVQKLLWDARRDFFFPMFMRDERDKDGNVVKAKTLTYQSGKFAGNSHGREEIGFVPWQFELPDAGYESAWKFLMDRDYFFADFGPATVERDDPQFVLQKTCCWWSGQSWPYATTQTLKALANLLHDYKQSFVTRADYLKLLHVYTHTHRKNGRPYIAEAAHPDTGSWEGHDSYNHSEHYFHSGYNDLIITGLIGLKPRADDVVEIDPLSPQEWPYFALDDLPYHGHQLAILWDKTGARYARGPGLHLLADGKEIASLNGLGKIVAKLPGAVVPSLDKLANRVNYAVNNDGDYFPQFTASFANSRTPLWRINDGNYGYHLHPPNRWTCAGSTNRSDWVAVDFGLPRRIDMVKLYFLDDGTNIVAPESFSLEFWKNGAWKVLADQERTPEKPAGHRANVIRFAGLEVQKLRAVFSHAQNAFTGLTEFEAWGEADLPYTAPQFPAGDLALNRTGQGFPKASASFSDRSGAARLAIDGKINFGPTPPNRWSCLGSTNQNDWFEVDFGAARTVGRVELCIYDDGRGVQAPANYIVQYWTGDRWRETADQRRSPQTPVGGMLNSATFSPVNASKLRVFFTHAGAARSGLTELLAFEH